MVGLYRLCGSAAVKKELREAFEKDSKAVMLCESRYPDINVITGNTIAGGFCVNVELYGVPNVPCKRWNYTLNWFSVAVQQTVNCFFIYLNIR